MESLELEETYYAVETEIYDIPYDIYPVIGLVIRHDGFHYLYRYSGRICPVEKYDAFCF